MEDVNAEWRRLQGLYTGLGDGQLLDLMRDRAGLTEVAQQALDAEVATRGLTLPVGEEGKPEPDADLGEGEDAAEVGLLRFTFAGDAETAVAALEEAGISSRIDHARGRETEGGPEVRVPGLDLFVLAGDQADAKHVLRKKMKLFPLAEVDSDDATAEEESLFIAGTFDKQAEADSLVTALTDAGIKATKTEVVDDDGTFWNVGVDFDDLEPALEVAEKLAGGSH